MLFRYLSLGLVCSLLSFGLISNGFAEVRNPLHLKKIVSSWDPVPSLSGMNFLGIGSPAIGKSGVSFVGSLPVHGGSSGGTGVYFCPFRNSQSCVKLVDGFTDFPNGINQVTGATPATVDDDEITFAIFGTHQQQAIVSMNRHAVGQMNFVATQRTLNLEGPEASTYEASVSWPYMGESAILYSFVEQMNRYGVLQLFFLTSADKGVTTFSAIPTLGSQAVYLRDNNIQYIVASDANVDPVLIQPFVSGSFSNVTTDRWVTAFGAATSSSYGIYKRRFFRSEYPGQTGGFSNIEQLAITGMDAPGTFGLSQFQSFGDQPSVKNDRVAFSAMGTAGELGIYLSDDRGLSLVANTLTQVPAGTGSFTSLGRASHVGDVCLSDNHVVFRAEGTSGQVGIYVWQRDLFGRSRLTKLIDNRDQIAGVSDQLEIQNLDVEAQCAEGNRVVVTVEFKDRQTGIYQGTGIFTAPLNIPDIRRDN